MQKYRLNATSPYTSCLFLSMLKYVLLALLIVLLPLLGSAQEPIKGYYPYEYNSLPYRMWGENDDSKGPYSLVVYLHGAGEKGNNNQRQILQGSDIIDSLTSYLQRTQRRCLVVVPQCPWDKQWVNADWSKGTYSANIAGFSAELQTVVDIVLDLRTRKNIDSSKIYVMGSSMGGFGVWDLLLRKPDLFAAAVPICGAADTSGAELIAKTPAWAFHAEGDLVVPVSGSREIVERLRKLGSRIKYTEYTFEPHIVWPRVAREPDIFDWMFSNVRTESSVRLEMEDRSRLSYNANHLQLAISGGDWRRATLILHNRIGVESLKTTIARERQQTVTISHVATDGMCFYTLIVDTRKIERGKLLLEY
jgi:predicted esterase